MHSLNRASVIAEIQAQFIEQGWTLAVAESCTGGALSAAIAKLAGASQYFMGGVVSYHRSVKEQLLKVPSPLMKVVGEVSEPVVKAMAQGIRDQWKVTWSVAITGVAGPAGGSVEKPVGTVCFSVIGPGFEQTQKRQFGELERSAIQEMSVDYALSALYRAVRPTGRLIELSKK